MDIHKLALRQSGEEQEVASEIAKALYGSDASGPARWHEGLDAGGLRKLDKAFLDAILARRRSIGMAGWPPGVTRFVDISEL
jgi:hypothetical protein